MSADFAQKQGILPAGSIEAQVWDGSYVIEYRYDTGTVYGVFFTEGSQEDLESFYATGTGRTSATGGFVAGTTRLSATTEGQLLPIWKASRSRSRS